MKTIIRLTKRNILLMTRDKMALFFSLLAPLIILLLYILFLGDIQADQVKYFVLGEDESTWGSLSSNLIDAVVNSWLIAGVMGVGCITVSLSATSVMIRDRESKANDDYIASPLKSRDLYLGYFFGIFILTAMLMGIVLIISLAYLAISQSFYLSLMDVLAAIGVLVLSSASSSLIMMLFTVFIKTEGTHAAFTGIMAAIAGFLIGAYMPVTSYPKGIQYFANVLPGSHSAALFRNIMMNGALDELGKSGTPEAMNEISKYFSLDLNLFGSMHGWSFLLLYLAISTVIMLILDIVLFSVKGKKAK